ncbi:microtubule-associated protein 6 [Lasius niger]|uniref:Microtubule-associated protein 6 n=1 Tax=Lasius niger TaxID=67767 RepID=A0A0J7K373_LASNI|nr:microtubule-associated protein 6 [Lasius niger]
MIPANKTNIEESVEVPMGTQESNEPEIQGDVPDQTSEAEQPTSRNDDDEIIGDQAERPPTTKDDDKESIDV